MAKNRNLFELLLLVTLCLSALLSSGFLNRQLPVPAGNLRSQVLQIARAEIGTTDRPGHGAVRGADRVEGSGADRVAQYLAYTHLGPGYEWCAAFVSWCFGQAGMDEPRTPWSPALFPRARQLSRVSDARPGDVFGLWIREKGRIGHAGFIESVEWDGTGKSGLSTTRKSGWVVTVEGNNRHAVRRVRRPVSSLHVVADWSGGSL